MKKLTLKQGAVLAYIKGFINANGYPPIPKDIQNQFGYASENSALCHLDLIEKKGYIKRTQGVSRSIVVLQA